MSANPDRIAEAVRRSVEKTLGNDAVARLRDAAPGQQVSVTFRDKTYEIKKPA